MFAAYLYQSVNLLTGVLMVPLLLRYLDSGQFVMWAIFTTLGGLTLQLESSIQVVSVRRIAHAHHAGKTQAVVDRHASAKRMYRMLAAFTLMGVASAGAAYLMQTASGKLAASWKLEWTIFMLTYGINYWFGANTATLLAMGRVTTYNYIAAFTRALNLAVTFACLVAGWGVFGICASFALSVALNCMLIGLAARRTLAHAQLEPELSQGATSVPSHQGGDIVRHTLFMLAAYAVYKGGVLIAAWHFPKEEVSSYSLMLQAFTMLCAFALAPIQVWLPKLMKAIVVNDRDIVMRELSRTLLVANGTFLAGGLLLGLVGHRLLDVIGARISLPPAADLAITGVALAIELNLFILINLLVSRQQFEFVKLYLGCVALALLCTASAVWLQQPLMHAFVILPALVQGLVCLPLIVRLLCMQLELAPAAFARSLLRGLQRA
jgi:hypothetical protein